MRKSVLLVGLLLLLLLAAVSAFADPVAATFLRYGYGPGSWQQGFPYYAFIPGFGYKGVTQVFLTGVATGIGVEATARQAYDQGFNVVAVTDAMTDLDPDMHRHAVEKVFPKIGERALTAEVLGQLDPG